jgi:hypothetical protein
MTNENTTPETDHARDNADGWMNSILEYVAALECDFDRLEEMRDEKTSLVDAVDECEEAYKFHDGDDTKSTPEWGDLVKARADLREWIDEYADELAELEAAAGDNRDAEEARERLMQSALDVSIRSDWHTPGEGGEPTDFRILLITGGPALQIRGELDDNREPYRAWLEYQDWGTPWTEYFGDNLNTDALLTFARCFYFGE